MTVLLDIALGPLSKIMCVFSMAADPTSSSTLNASLDDDSLDAANSSDQASGSDGDGDDESANKSMSAMFSEWNAAKKAQQQQQEDEGAFYLNRISAKIKQYSVFTI